MTASGLPNPDAVPARPALHYAIVSFSVRTAPWLVVLLGLGIRIRELDLRRSLWLDEAMLAVNILERSFPALLRPLDLEQVAPPLYLWLTRSAVLALGPSEISLRLVPFLASCAFVLVFWSLTRRLLSGPWALLALGFGAVSPILLEYSAELKQYALDALASTTILLLTIGVIRDPAAAVRRRNLLAAGVAVSWLSTPAPFVLAASWAGLMASVLREGKDLPRRWLGLTPVVWAIAFLVPYLLVYHEAASQPYLARYWSEFYPAPLEPGFLGRTSIAVSGTLEKALFGSFLELPAALLIAALLVVAIGLGRLAREHGPGIGVMLISLPVLFAGAALAERYPPAPRLLLALVPIVILGFAGGLVTLVSAVRPPGLRRPIAAGLGLLSLVPAASLAAIRSRAGSDPAPFRPAVERLRSEARTGDVVYLYARVLPVWAYYTVDWSGAEGGRLRSILSAAYRLGPNSGNRPSRGAPVVREGDDYVLSGPFGTELFGIPTGVEHPVRPGGRTTPDPGWAENEVRRIRERCASRAWLLFSHGSDAAEAAMLPVLVERGLVEEFRSRTQAVRLYRFVCPASAASRTS